MIKIHNIEKIKELSNRKNYKTDKELFGEVFTPFYFIDNIFKIFPENIFKNHNLKWLDPGAGTGNFSIYLYFKLLESLSNVIPDEYNRK